MTPLDRHFRNSLTADFSELSSVMEFLGSYKRAGGGEKVVFFTPSLPRPPPCKTQAALGRS